jgi:hypothetical protein
MRGHGWYIIHVMFGHAEVSACVLCNWNEKHLGRKKVCVHVHREVSACACIFCMSIQKS